MILTTSRGVNHIIWLLRWVQRNIALTKQGIEIENISLHIHTAVSHAKTDTN
jgi:hypothetical protein